MGIVVDMATARREIGAAPRFGMQASPHSRPHTVRLDEPGQQAYWCRHFRATPEQLSSIVREVGSNPAIVQLYFHRR